MTGVCPHKRVTSPTLADTNGLVVMGHAILRERPRIPVRNTRTSVSMAASLHWVAIHYRVEGRTVRTKCLFGLTPFS